MNRNLIILFIFFFYTINLVAQESIFDIIYNHINAGEYKEALEIINTEIKKSDYSTQDINTLLFNKGMVFEFENSLDSAIWCYENVLFTDSLHIPSLNSLGMLYGDFKYYDEAYELFYKLIEIDSTITLAYSNIIYYKGLEGQYNDAIKIAKKTLPRTSDTIATALIYNNMSFAQLKLNQLEGAYESATKSLKLLEDNSYAYRNLGLINLKMGNKDEACENFQRSEELGGTEDIFSLLQNNCEQ